MCRLKTNLTRQGALFPETHTHIPHVFNKNISMYMELLTG